MVGKRRRSNSPSAVFLLSHSKDWFPAIEDLTDYLEDQLPFGNKGRYYVVSAAPYVPLEVDDIVLFHKLRKFVGEARVSKKLVERAVVRKGDHFEGWIVAPKTIVVYKQPIAFSVVEKKLGKRLSSRRPYAIDPEIYPLIPLKHARR